MYRFTHAYKVWKSAPHDIFWATTPQDFAKGWEKYFLRFDGWTAHFIHHIKQHFGLHVGFLCECSQFEKLGL